MELQQYWDPSCVFPSCKWYQGSSDPPAWDRLASSLLSVPHGLASMEKRNVSCKFAVFLKKLHAISHRPRGSTCCLLILPSSERVALLWVPKTSGESCKFHRFFGIPAYLWLLSGQFVHPWLGTPPNLDQIPWKVSQLYKSHDVTTLPIQQKPMCNM